MYYELTLKITPELIRSANGNERFSLMGHLGTHFDVMDKEFPLENLSLQAIVFDVSHIRGRDIDVGDIILEHVQPRMFVAFYTGYLDEFGYGNSAYFNDHIQLSEALIERLIEKRINIIGVDCPGIRSGSQHTPKDQYCADHGVFVVENMTGMKTLLVGKKELECRIHTYPVNYSHMTGLPCRVVAEL